MENALVSIILPVKNGEDYIRSAIESVLNQYYTNFELIIVDASDDRTPQIIGAFNDPRIRYYKQQTKGSVGAYNEAVERYVKGEYVTFIHHDDLYTPNKISEQMRTMQMYDDVDCVYNNIRYGNSSMSLIKYDIHEDFYHRTNDLLAYSFARIGIRNGGMNILIRRSFIERRRLQYDPAFPITCDAKYILDMAQSGATFKLLPKTLYHYRIHGGNYSGDKVKTEREYQSLLHYYGAGRILEAVEQSNLSEEGKAGLMGRIWSLWGQCEEADRFFEDKLGALGSPMFYFYYAVYCYQAGERIKAEAALHKALAQAGHMAEAWNNLGCCAMLRGDVGYAGECFEKAKSLMPNYKDVCRNVDNIQNGAGAPPLFTSIEIEHPEQFGYAAMPAGETYA